MNVELDVEKRLQAWVAKDRIRIKEFFIDFDKLRKGVVGEAAVSIIRILSNLFYISSAHALVHLTLDSVSKKFRSFSANINKKMDRN